MNKVNLYFFKLSSKYIFTNLIFISLFILFLNLIELSRILKEGENTFINYATLSLLKFPSILNEIIPFVTIIAISFLVRNLINNNEFVSLRNIGYSIFDIFKPIGLAVFLLNLLYNFHMHH